MEAKAAIGLLLPSAAVLLSLLLWKGLGQGRGADLRQVDLGGILQWYGFPSLPNGGRDCLLQWLILHINLTGLWDARRAVKNHFWVCPGGYF